MVFTFSVASYPEIPRDVTSGASREFAVGNVKWMLFRLQRSASITSSSPSQAVVDGFESVSAPNVFSQCKSLVS